MCEQKLINIKTLEKELIELSIYIYTLKMALANPEQKSTDTSPYAHMAEIINRKLHKIMDILFD